MAYSWSQLGALSSERLIHLSTRGRTTGKTHKVELWFAWRDGKVYLSHEGDLTDWMKNLSMNSEVEFEIGGKMFSGKGSILDGGQEFDEGKRALYEKYYGDATKEVVDDWFSLSRVVAIEQPIDEVGGHDQPGVLE